MNFSRRDLVVLLPALAAADAAAQMQKKGPEKADSGPPPVLGSKTYEFNDMPERVNAAKTGKTRMVDTGITTRGLKLSMHLSELAPGAFPHLPHQHLNEEAIILREGTLEVELHAKIGEFGHGQTSRIGPGSLIFVASNDPHGMRNVGQTWAKYSVVEIGDR